MVLEEMQGWARDQSFRSTPNSELAFRPRKVRQSRFPTRMARPDLGSMHLTGLATKPHLESWWGRRVRWELTTRRRKVRSEEEGGRQRRRACLLVLSPEAQRQGVSVQYPRRTRGVSWAVRLDRALAEYLNEV